MRDIFDAIGEKANEAHWRLYDVEAFGPSAERVNEWARPSRAIPGTALAEALKGVIQTVEGSFEGVLPTSRSPWVRIQPVEGTFFEITTQDKAVIEALRSRFSTVDLIEDEPLS